jgi:hypothetical protein
MPAMAFDVNPHPCSAHPLRELQGLCTLLTQPRETRAVLDGSGGWVGQMRRVDQAQGPGEPQLKLVSFLTLNLRLEVVAEEMKNCRGRKP